TGPSEGEAALTPADALAADLVGADAEPLVVAETPLAPASVAPTAEPETVEAALGLKWATRIGGALLLLGAAFFFKYAVDRNWLGPWARVALGAGSGVAALVIAAFLRRKANATWVHVVA